MDARAPVAGNELKALVHGIEKLAAERDLIGRRIAGIYKQAKEKGYDRKALHQTVRLRAMDPHERAAHDTLVASYVAAVERAEQESAAALTERIPYPTKARLMAGR
jgi:uncharacterized protein (UPF0335 family)